MQFDGAGTERYLQPGPTPLKWQTHQNERLRPLYGPNSELSWMGSYFSQGTFGGNVRLEAAIPPRWEQPPYAVAAKPESGYLPCGPTRQCAWGGNQNSGTPVWQNGQIVMRGFCMANGKCDSPIGQNDRGEGIALRDAMGSVVWPNSQITAPSSDPYQFY